MLCEIHCHEKLEGQEFCSGFGCAGLLILQGCQFWAPSALKLGQDTTKAKFLLRHAFAVEFPYHVMMVYLI